METRLTLRPGMPGTKKLLARYGERLICVRYLVDKERGRRLKTIELVIEETPWSGPSSRSRRDGNEIVAVRIDWKETELRIAVKRAGGIWRPRHRLWEVSREAVRMLGFGHRVVEPPKAAAARDQRPI